jgi:hypothetical protein
MGVVGSRLDDSGCLYFKDQNKCAFVFAGAAKWTAVDWFY